MSEIVSLIRSRGYWDVEIRPNTFREDRIAKKTQLRDILRNSVIRLRGWDFPHIDRDRDPEIKEDRIEQESRWNHFIESFRFYQSGLFVDLSAFKDDWRDESGGFFPPDRKDWAPGKDLGVTEVVYRFTEILELTSRLANTPAGDEVMTLKIRCVRLEGRTLQVGPDRMPFLPAKTAHTPEFNYSKQLSKPQLANPRELALEPATKLFDLFGWDAPLDMLRDTQQYLRR